MKKILTSILVLLWAVSAYAQVVKPPIPNVAGPTTSAQLDSIITNNTGPGGLLMFNLNPVVSGTLSATASISAGTFVNAAAGSGYQLGGVTAFSHNANHTVLTDPSNAIYFIQGGNNTDPTNLYNNTTHTFQSRASAWYATLNSVGLNVSGLGAFSGALTASNFTGASSGTNTGDQTITLTGDVAGSGGGSFAATLATVNSNVGTFGGSTAIPTMTVNAKGLVTAVSTSAVVAPAGTLTGATLAPNVLASSLTSLGTIAALAATTATIDHGSVDSTTSLTLSNTGASGINIKMTGSGATTPIKYLRVIGGEFQIVNSAYGVAILSLTDAGALSVPSTLSASNLSGTNTGDQTITLTGDVTGSGTGSFAATLAAVNGNVGTFGSATQGIQATFNAKGLATAVANVTITPAVGSIIGLGTGVATALGVNAGSAGAFVTLNGALGTPSSGTATNLTGLPLSSGVTGTLAAAQFPALTGDVTTSAGALATTLATVATGATTGGSTAIPVITFNNKGLVTAISTAAVIAPAGTVTGATLAPNVLASSLTSLGTIAALTTNFVSLLNGIGIIHSTAAGIDRYQEWQTAGVARWQMGTSSTAETGADAGSNFFLSRLNDAGIWLGFGLYIDRATGAVAMSGALTASNFSGTLTGTNTGDQTITLTGDVTGSGGGSFATTLASVISANTQGGSTAIPVLTYDAKGRLTTVTTAAVIAPAGTLSGGTLAPGVTASSLTSLGTITTLNAGTVAATSYTGSASAMTVLATGSTTARSLAARAAQKFHVMDWGALCDGATNDAAAINVAAAAAGAAGGGHVVIPDGKTCKYGAAIDLPTKVYLVGGGPLTSVLSASVQNINGVNINGSFAGIRDLSIDCGAAGANASGYCIDIKASSNEVYIQNFRLVTPFVGIRSYNAILSTIENGYIYYPTASTGIGILIDGSGSSLEQTIRHVMVFGNPAAEPYAGMSVRDTQALYLWGFSTLDAGNGIVYEPGTGQIITWVWDHGGIYDSGTGDGILIQPTGTGSIRGIQNIGTWTATNTLRGIHANPAGTATVDDVHFTDHRSFNNTREGARIVLGTNYHFSGGSFCGNSAVAGTYSAIYFDAVSQFSIKGVNASNCAGFTTPQSKYGIEIANAASDQFVVTGNNLIGNVTGALSLAPTRSLTKIAHSNVGAGDSGNFNVPVISTGLQINGASTGIYGQSTSSAYTISANPLASFSSGGFISLYGSAAANSVGIGTNSATWTTWNSAGLMSHTGNIAATGSVNSTLSSTVTNTFGYIAALQSGGGTGWRWTLNNDNNFYLQHTTNGFAGATNPLIMYASGAATFVAALRSATLGVLMDPVASATSVAFVNGDLTLAYAQGSIMSNIYYASGWKHAANGPGWALVANGSTAVAFYGATVNAGGAGAAASLVNIADFNVLTGASTFYSSISAGTFVNAASASGYQLGGTIALYRSGDYTLFKDSGGTDLLYLGNATTPVNYYLNTTHSFQSRASAEFFSANTTRLNIPLTTASTSTTTGALTVAGGLGAVGAGWFGGNLNVGATALVQGDGTNAFFRVSGSGNGVYMGHAAGHWTALTANNFYPYVDNNTSLGTSGNRWGSLWTFLPSTANTNLVCYNSTTGEHTYQAFATGCAVSSAFYKRDISYLSRNSILDKVAAMRPASYKYKDGLGFDNDNHFGLIAEDVAKIDPELVSYEADGRGPRAVKYQEIISLLTGAISALKADNDNIRQEFEALKRRVNAR